MDNFKSIRLQKKTVERFRKTSPKYGRSYSDTLEAMLDFFQWHGISPFDRFGPKL